MKYCNFEIYFWNKPYFVQVIEICICTNRTQIIVLEIHHSKMNKERNLIDCHAVCVIINTGNNFSTHTILAIQ